MSQLRAPVLFGLVSGSSSLMAGQLALVGIGFAQTLAGTRLLGADHFGAWALILSLTTLTNMFLSFRTSEAFTSYWVEARLVNPSAEGALVSSAAWAEVATKTAALVALCLVGPLVLRAAQAPPGAETALTIVAGARFLSFFDPIWFSVLRSDRSIGVLTMQPIVVALLQLCLSVAFCLFWNGHVLAFAAAMLVAQAASLAWKMVGVRHRLARSLFGPQGLVLSPWKTFQTRLLHRGFWRMMTAGYFSSCLSSAVKEGDGVLIGLLGGAVDVGYYRLAKSMAGLVQTAAQSLSTLLFQHFAELVAAGDATGIRRFVGRIAPLMAIVALLGAGAVALCIRPLISTVFGARYLLALPPFYVLLLGISISSALAWVSPLLTMLRRMREVLILNLLTFAIFVLVLAATVHGFGPLAPAIALSAAWGVGHLAGLWCAIGALKRTR